MSFALINFLASALSLMIGSIVINYSKEETVMCNSGNGDGFMENEMLSEYLPFKAL